MMKSMNKSAMAKWGRARSYWQLYVFLLLPVLYLFLFQYVPMCGIIIAFKRFAPITGIFGSPWLGFQNFTRFFQSYEFVRVIKNTLTLSLYSLIAGFPIPILFALILNTIGSKHMKRATQTITYMPHFISVIVVVGILLEILHPRYGLYGMVCHVLTGSAAPDLLGRASAFPHLYVWSGIWQEFGWDSVIYTAALSGVNPELHEAAAMDGASRFQRISYVDFPCILPTVTIMLILRAGQIMNIGFEKIFLMQNDLNLSNSEVISTYTYKVSLAAGGLSDFSYSTAISLFNSVINLILILLVNYACNKMSETSLW